MTIHKTPVWKMCINEGNAALAEGRGFDAQAHFASAEGQGLPPAFAAVHSAMALLLLGRHSVARATVETAIPHAAGVFVHAQLLALSALADALCGRPDAGALGRLENCLLELADIGLPFDLNQSDLHNLMRGLVVRHKLTDRPRSVFRLLVAWPAAVAA